MKPSLFGRDRLAELLPMETRALVAAQDAVGRWGERVGNSNLITAFLGARLPGGQAGEIVRKHLGNNLITWLNFQAAFSPHLARPSALPEASHQLGADGAEMLARFDQATVRALRIGTGSGPFHRVRDLLTDEDLILHRLDVPGCPAIPGDITFGFFYPLDGFIRAAGSGLKVEERFHHLFIELLTERAGGAPVGAWARDNYPTALGIMVELPKTHLERVDVIECHTVYQARVSPEKITRRLEASPDLIANGDESFTVTQVEQPPLQGTTAILTIDQNTGRYRLGQVRLDGQMLILHTSSKSATPLARKIIETLLGNRIAFQREMRQDVAAQMAQKGARSRSGSIGASIDASVPFHMRREMLQNAHTQLTEHYMKMLTVPVPQIKGTLPEVLKRDPNLAEDFLVLMVDNMTEMLGPDAAQGVAGDLMGKAGVPSDMAARIMEAVRIRGEAQAGPVQPHESVSPAEFFRRGGYDEETECSVGDCYILGAVPIGSGEILIRSLACMEAVSTYVMKVQTELANGPAYTAKIITDFLGEVFMIHGKPQGAVEISKTVWMSSDALKVDPEIIEEAADFEGMNFPEMPKAEREAVIAWGQDRNIRLAFNGDANTTPSKQV